MADYKAPLRDMRFVLNEVFEVAKLWAQLPALAETVDAETVEAILEEAGKVTSKTVAPLSRASPSAVAAPPMSFFINRMALDGFKSRPPLSKQTPLPTSVTLGWAGLPQRKSSSRGGWTLARPTAWMAG